MHHFLRLTRHAPTASHVAAICTELNIAPEELTIHTEDVGDYGATPRSTIAAHIRGVCARLGSGLAGVEVTAPGHILDSLGTLPAIRYRAVMARGDDNRVLVQLDETGAPVRGADGRDVLLVARYERVAEQDGSIHWPDGGPNIRYDAETGQCDCEGSHRSECYEVWRAT